MTTKQSPGWRAGGKEKRMVRMNPSYPAKAPAVKLCMTCGYFRALPFRHWRRTFCRFTGERVPASWSCVFWTGEGGAA